jgi:amidohydrolase
MGMTDSLLTLRHDLHQHPELSGQETETARRIIHFVKPFNPTRIVSSLGGNGVAIIYEFGQTEPGQNTPTLLFRSELDALPIQEVNSFAHRSGRAGVSHKCGHDGHSTILAGLAMWLQQASFATGRVVLLFQPAEEIGQGAKAVLEDPCFAAFRPDYVFALHNIPGYPLHEVVWVSGQFSPTVQSMAIKLFGKESHASEPENGINPSLAVAELVTTFNQYVITDPARPDFALITPVHLLVGQRDYGISAGYGEAHFTLRCWQTEGMNALVLNLERELADICTRHKLRSETNWFDYFPTTVNDAYCNSLVTQSAVKAGLSIRQRPTPFKFGEDFGWFTQAFRGAMFGLGAGEPTPALHNPDYDFPDELIETGVRIFSGIIEGMLGQSVA